MSQDYAPAKWIGTSHYWSGRNGNTPRWIVVHGTAGGTSADNVGYYFQNNDPPTSTHFVIGLNGEVVQCVSEADSAWGNGVVTQGHDPWWSSKLNPNFVTFSIEHVKPATDNSSQLTQKQKEASFKLIEHLCEKYNIPKRKADANGGITPHSAIDPVNKSMCPGPYPWDELFAYLNGAPMNKTPGTPKGWSDDGKTLTAPNGKKVTLGFRWYILNHPNWDPNNYPLENEHYEQVADITNSRASSGTVQHFRRSVLVWEQQSGDIYDAMAGALAMQWQQRAVAAEKQLKDRPAPDPLPSQPTGGAGNASVAANMAYIPPSGAATSTGAALVLGGGAAAAGVALAGDPVSQRISGLEQQIQALLNGLQSDPKMKKIVKDVEQQVGQLANPTVRRSLISNPKSLLRWFLMILGLLFSDAVAWVVSSLTQHQGSLPLPFLTVGALVSGLTFLGVFRIPR